MASEWSHARRSPSPHSDEVGNRRDVSRRLLLAGAVAAAAPLRAFADDTATQAAAKQARARDRADAPVVPKTVVKVFNDRPRILHPNALQFAPDGKKLLILDQDDPNKLFTVDPQNGEILAELQTESLHGSGVTYGDGALWIASTKGPGKDPPEVLKVDPASGATLKKFPTAGAGLYGKVTTPSGAHGLRWVGKHYWMAVPASESIDLVEPESGAIVRSIPAPTTRTHDIAWDEGALWCVGTDEREIYKLDPKNGKILAKISLAKDDPNPHGFDIYKGQFWYCDAESGWICKLV